MTGWFEISVATRQHCQFFPDQKYGEGLEDKTVPAGSHSVELGFVFQSGPQSRTPPLAFGGMVTLDFRLACSGAIFCASMTLLETKGSRGTTAV
jgi:hypothetical protein